MNIDEPKSLIKNELRSKQINDFKKLIRHRGITPTDIDGLIDYRGNAFLFFEGKYGDFDLPKGQRNALENISRALSKNNTMNIVIVYNHYVDSEDSVDVGIQTVSKFFYNKKWHEPKKKLTVLDAVILFENFCKKKNISI